MGDLVNTHFMSERFWHLCCYTVYSVDFNYLFLHVLPWLGHGANSFWLQSFMLYYDQFTIFLMCSSWNAIVSLICCRNTCVSHGACLSKAVLDLWTLWSSSNSWICFFILPSFIFLPRLIVVFLNSWVSQGN